MNTPYKTPKSAMRLTVNDILQLAERMEHAIKQGQYSEAHGFRDEIDDLLVTIGEQLETHLD